ncbi:MAG: hypothetical protein CMJ19_08955 [Phycisphaeraceae bacterium]|nr:hypothetical protein [Phycisphaeraceae bacterium]
MPVVIVCLASFFAAKYIRRRAFATLTYDQAIFVVDAYAQLRKWVLPLLGLYLLSFLALMYSSLSFASQTVIHFVIWALVAILFILINAVKMTKLEMPANFVNLFLLSRFVSLVGTAFATYLLLMLVYQAESSG